jgi:hypothetical protein
MTTTSAIGDTPTITLKSPADLVAAAPYLLGFHPSHSVVVLAFRDRSLTCAARGDLAGPDGRPETVARDLIDAIGRQPATAVAILAYGPADRASTAAAAVRAAAERRGLAVRDALRVDRGRWWSYLCDDPACCPADGTPFDPRSSEVAAHCAFQGLAALPDRAHLAGQVAPVEGKDRASMTRATDRAWRRLSARLGSLPEDAGREAVLTEGRAAAQRALERYESGGRLDDDEVAWLTVLLLSIPVRDEVWLRLRGADAAVRLWSDVTRRADPELAPAPASLLAFAAWRSGNGALAGLALERALDEDPSYSMAQLLMHGLRHGLPPSALDDWGTPDGDPPGGDPPDVLK